MRIINNLYNLTNMKNEAQKIGKALSKTQKTKVVGGEAPIVKKKKLIEKI